MNNGWKCITDKTPDVGEVCVVMYFKNNKLGKLATCKYDGDNGFQPASLEDIHGEKIKNFQSDSFQVEMLVPMGTTIIKDEYDNSDIKYWIEYPTDRLLDNLKFDEIPFFDTPKDVDRKWFIDKCGSFYFYTLSDDVENKFEEFCNSLSA